VGTVSFRVVPVQRGSVYTRWGMSAVRVQTCGGKMYCCSYLSVATRHRAGPAPRTVPVDTRVCSTRSSGMRHRSLPCPRRAGTQGAHRSPCTQSYLRTPSAACLKKWMKDGSTRGALSERWAAQPRLVLHRPIHGRGIPLILLSSSALSDLYSVSCSRPAHVILIQSVSTTRPNLIKVLQ
jgi:hypothetical protein